MGIGASIFLFAAGAILRFAVTASTKGLDVHVVGVILMIVGGVGLLLSLLFWSSVAPFGTRRETIARDDFDHVDHVHHSI